MNTVLLKTAFEELADVYCQCFGNRHCVNLLMENCGLTKDNLLELGFDEEDIDAVIEDPDKALAEEA